MVVMESSSSDLMIFLLLYLSCCLGVYGDVVRVKVLFNKKDNALIQMAEAHQASIALQHLDKMKLFGKIMRVTSSKHGVVQLPKVCEDLYGDHVS